MPARTVLERLNTRGDVALQERREVLRRIVEFSNYDACWPNDQLKAKGLVASIRDIVTVTWLGSHRLNCFYTSRSGISLCLHADHRKAGTTRLLGK